MVLRIRYEEQFVEAVRSVRSVRGVFQAIGLYPTGANHKTVADTVARLKLDTSHWKGQGYLEGLSHNFSRKTPMEEILVENSTFHDLSHLKARLVRDGLLEKPCAICGLVDWPISLVLDHINGGNNDHRLENLRFLCPDCNSQQDTFAGRNKLLMLIPNPQKDLARRGSRGSRDCLRIPAFLCFLRFLCVRTCSLGIKSVFADLV